MSCYARRKVLNVLNYHNSWSLLSKTASLFTYYYSYPYKNAFLNRKAEMCTIISFQALDDHNTIWGIISAIAINQDGRSVTPITRPAQKQQEKLLQSIYSTHVDPLSVQYIEAHGTGTSAGDSAEAHSLGNIIGKNRHQGASALMIGSVKGNIGHTESAAGMAGLIKVLLMMHHERIVPSLHYSDSVSSINTQKLNLSIPVSLKVWEESHELGRGAGISGFGFGGTNVHVVIRQLKQPLQKLPVRRPYEMFLLSAASWKSLQLTMQDTAHHLGQSVQVSLPNLAYTAACRRSHLRYPYRKAFITTSSEQLRQQLESAAREEMVPTRDPPQLIFVCCGNGLFYPGMGKVLLKNEPVFREKCQEIAKLFLQYDSRNFLELLDNEYNDFLNPEIAQPLLFMLQVALVSILKFWGVVPNAILGSSVGEVAAAHCAGVISLEDAVKVIHCRSKSQAKVSGGKMLVVGNIPVEEISETLVSLSIKVSIGAFNSPCSCTLSGDAATIAMCQKVLAQRYGQRNIFLYILSVSTAYHSYMMDPILKDVEEDIGVLVRRKAEIEVISTVTGKTASKEDFTTGKYWSRNIREPVNMIQAFTTVATGRENAIYVEIAPKRFLQRNIRETLGEQIVVFPSLQPNKEYETLFHLVKSLFEFGYNLNWPCFYEGLKATPTAYPRYKFDHKNLKTYIKSLQLQNKIAFLNHPLISSTNGNLDFSCFITQDMVPYVFEHINNGTPLVPGSCFVELGLASVRDSLKPLSTCQVRVDFLTPCIVSQGFLDIKVQLELGETEAKFVILSSSAIYATGEIIKTKKSLNETQYISLGNISQRCKTVLTQDEFYKKLLEAGFQYGTIFKQLSTISICGELNEGMTTIRVSKDLQKEMYKYHIHPVLLDCFLQIAFVVATKDVELRRKASFPSKIGKLTVFKDLEGEMNIYVKKTKSTENSFEVCGFFTDTFGFILAKLEEITFKSSELQSTDNFLLKNTWKQISQIEMLGSPSERAPFLVLADTFGIAELLKKYLPYNSKYIGFQEWESQDVMRVGDMIKSEIKDFHRVLFMWGIKKLNEEISETLLQNLTKCCEAFRQIILALKDQNADYSVTVITYRTIKNIDHINPGFALAGLTRTSLMEVPGITFQMVDINDTTPQNIVRLAEVIIKCHGKDYPELSIDQGKIFISEIRHTSFEKINDSKYLEIKQNSEIFTLYTSNPYKVVEVTAETENDRQTLLESQYVEVEMDKICIHSEDYFPISISSSKFGNSLYWAADTTEKHKLLALDFSGTVTAIGKDVQEVNIGDHIATCFPVVASSKVLVPDIMCFQSKKFLVFESVPCVSYFIIAWKILTQILPNASQLSLLAVLSSQPGSVLGEVLTFAAKEVGWEATLLFVSADLRQKIKQCQALILLSYQEELFREILSDLPHLQDVVLLCGQHQPAYLQQFLYNGHPRIKIHVLNLSQILQKSCLIASKGSVCKWLKSVNFKSNFKLPSTLFQPNALVNPAVSSYFTCVAIPLIVLKGNVSEDQLSPIPLFKAKRKLFSANGVYIVSGGHSGLGFETVKFIVQKGGGSVVILSRQSPTYEQQREIKFLENQNQGCRIISLRCNVSFYSEVEDAINSIGNIFPKGDIKGIFHSAVVLDDGPLEVLNVSRFEKVFNPKVSGAINLHLATRGQQLDYFVCYSSVSAFIGNESQANYAAANSFLDVFCHYRRNCGFAGQSISWGALNLGLLLNKHHLQSVLATKGILTLQIPEIHEYLEKCLILNNSQQAIIKFDFRKLQDNFSQFPSLQVRFSKLFQDKSHLPEIPCLTCTQHSSQMSIDEYVTSLVSEFMNTDIKDITMSTLLTSLGIDSISAMTIQSKLFNDLKIQIPLIKLLDPDTTLEKLKLFLNEQSNKS